MNYSKVIDICLKLKTLKAFIFIRHSSPVGVKRNDYGHDSNEGNANFTNRCSKASSHFRSHLQHHDVP